MSPVLSSHSMVLATAMALSGTVILFALRLQKSPPGSPLPSCIASPGDEKRKMKKKKVHFAEDVVDPTGNSDVYRKRYTHLNNINRGGEENDHGSTGSSKTTMNSKKKMPENRVALYNGILRDRVCHTRVTYSY